jgi:hypothetical protein
VSSGAPFEGILARLGNFFFCTASGWGTCRSGVLGRKRRGLVHSTVHRVVHRFCGVLHSIGAVVHMACG